MEEPLAVHPANGTLSINNAADEPASPSTTTPKDDNELNAEIPVSFGAVLRFSVYRRYLLFRMLLFIAFYERAAFLSGYGAAYFGGCHSIQDNNDCSRSYNYDRYNIFFQLQASVAAALAFLTAPLIGTLSDHFGRKPFLILQVVTYSAPYVVMSLYNNMYVLLAGFTLVGLNGSSNLSTPPSSAYIADILPQRLRIMGYALMYLLSGAGLLIGEVLGYAISAVFNDHLNFCVISLLYAACLAYLMLLIPEPPRTEQRSAGAKRYNPCSSLRTCCANDIVFWCALLNGLIALPAFGLVDIATVVLADSFDADSSVKYNRLALF